MRKKMVKHPFKRTSVLIKGFFITLYDFEEDDFLTEMVDLLTLDG